MNAREAAAEDEAYARNAEISELDGEILAVGNELGELMNRRERLTRAAT